ncbi:armadillo-type protein [Mycena capillaripes]|nr:armadillo-type protein [Mycena capillaripes]
MLKSSDVGARISSCRLVGNLASHEFAIPAILKLGACEQLVSLLRDGDYVVVAEATYTLSQFARWLDGAQAIVQANTLDHVSKLLESRTPNIRKCTCLLIGNLAWHDSTSLTVWGLRPCAQLVALLGDEDRGVIEQATYALSQIAGWLDGAQAIVDAQMLDHILELLNSRSPDVRNWTCELAENLASHKSTAPAVLELNPSKQFVFLLREPLTCTSAIFALCAISELPDGVMALACLDVSEELQELSQSTDAETRVQIHTILENLARHIEGIGIAL